MPGKRFIGINEYVRKKWEENESQEDRRIYQDY